VLRNTRESELFVLLVIKELAFSMEIVIWMPLCFSRFGLWIHPWKYQAFRHSAYVHLIFWHPMCMFSRWHLYRMPEYIFWHYTSKYTFWHPHILASYIVCVYEMTSIWDARIHILASYIRTHILASLYSGILYRERVHLYTYTQVMSIKSSVCLFYVGTTRDSRHYLSIPYSMWVDNVFYLSRYESR